MVSSHIETHHGMKSWPEPDMPSHPCPLCPFDSSDKSKVTRHMMSCQKRFIADRNLEPSLDWEPPTKISRVPTEGLLAFTPGINAGTRLHGSRKSSKPKVREYRQQASNQTSPDLNTSSCGLQIIRVGNLGESNEATLHRLFNSFGEIWWLKICPLRKPLGSRAALVKFRNPGDAEKAMACRDEYVIGKLEITRADPNHLWDEFLPIVTSV
jgi:hypothetical protein